MYPASLRNSGRPSQAALPWPVHGSDTLKIDTILAPLSLREEDIGGDGVRAIANALALVSFSFNSAGFGHE